MPSKDDVARYRSPFSVHERLITLRPYAIVPTRQSEVSQQEPPPSLRIRDLNQWLSEVSECSGSALSTRKVADNSRAFVALLRYLGAKLIHEDTLYEFTA